MEDIQSTPIPEQSLIVPGYDYTALDMDTASFVQGQTALINRLHQGNVRNIADIGEALLAVKQKLEHGQFADWLSAEFELSERTAENYMNVARQFKSETVSDLRLPLRALYLLAAPSTPADLRDTIIERAEAGEKITAAAVKQAVVQHDQTAQDTLLSLLAASPERRMPFGVLESHAKTSRLENGRFRVALNALKASGQVISADGFIGLPDASTNVDTSASASLADRILVALGDGELMTIPQLTAALGEMITRKAAVIDVVEDLIVAGKLLRVVDNGSVLPRVTLMPLPIPLPGPKTPQDVEHLDTPGDLPDYVGDACAYLEVHGETHFDTLAGALDLTPGELSGLLARLELQGKVRRQPGNNYRLGTTELRATFDQDQITLLGRTDNGAHHRAIEVARKLVAAGIWDGQTKIEFDAYTLHDKLFGVNRDFVGDPVPGVDFIFVDVPQAAESDTPAALILAALHQADEPLTAPQVKDLIETVTGKILIAYVLNRTLGDLLASGEVIKIESDVPGEFPRMVLAERATVPFKLPSLVEEETAAAESESAAPTGVIAFKPRTIPASLYLHSSVDFIKSSLKFDGLSRQQLQLLLDTERSSASPRRSLINWLEQLIPSAEDEPAPHIRFEEETPQAVENAESDTAPAAREPERDNRPARPRYTPDVQNYKDLIIDALRKSQRGLGRATELRKEAGIGTTPPEIAAYEQAVDDMLAAGSLAEYYHPGAGKRLHFPEMVEQLKAAANGKADADTAPKWNARIGRANRGTRSVVLDISSDADELLDQLVQHWLNGSALVQISVVFDEPASAGA